MTDSKVHKEGVDFVTTLRLTAQVHSPITARLFERAADEIERLSSTLSKAVYERDGFVESLIQLGRESAIAVTGDVDVVGAIITPDQAVTAIREECRLGREAAKDLNEESAYAGTIVNLLDQARSFICSHRDEINAPYCDALCASIDAALAKNPSSGGSSERAGGCTPVSSPGAPASKREDVGVVASPSLDGVLTVARAQAYPTMSAFFNKYALGTLAKPSCLICGRNDYAEMGIQHAELPSVVVCLPCRDAATNRPQMCNNTDSGFSILCDRLECQRDRRCYRPGTGSIE